MVVTDPLTIYKYKLRRGGTQSTSTRDFILQTFGGEKQQVDVYPSIFNLLTSNHMRGQGGQIESASYNRTTFKDVDNPDAGSSFTGQEIWPADFIQEEDIPGQGEQADYQPNFVS